MIHEQQGYHWQFEKTMKLRSETMNGSSGPEKADPAPELANTGQGNDPKQPTQQPPQPVAPLVKKPPPSETRLTRSPRPNIPKPAS